MSVTTLQKGAYSLSTLPPPPGMILSVFHFTSKLFWYYNSCLYLIIIIISILKPVFLYRGLGLFDKSSSKTSSPLRAVHRVSKIHSELLSDYNGVLEKKIVVETVKVNTPNLIFSPIWFSLKQSKKSNQVTGI